MFIKGKQITMTCGRCFKTFDNLAWFFGNSIIYNHVLLCRECFKFAFKMLSEKQKLEWSFYKNKKENNNAVK